MSDRFDVLHPPLRALHEHLKEELARNPFIAPAGFAHDEDRERPKRGDDPPDASPPDGPKIQPDG